MEIINYLTEPYLSYSKTLIALESIAACFGLLSVFFSVKKNILVFPTGIISTIIYTYLLYCFGLLGDMLINVYYSIMSVYGWIQWNQVKEQHNQIAITRTGYKLWLQCMVLFLLSAVLVCCVYYYKPLIDNNFNQQGIVLGFAKLDWANYVDIFVTSTFLIGMFLMAKRKVESWFFWIIGDLFCIPMMVYKGLGLTSIQYGIFTIMSVMGYLQWKKSMKN